MTLDLQLLRHGKSDWAAEYVGDRDRPLNGRGRRAAKSVGRFLTATGQQPDLVFTSPARRATETLDLARRAGGWSCPERTSDLLYGHGPIELLRLLAGEVPGTARRVLAVGHEPIWSEVVETLTGANVRFPTAAVAYIELDVSSWDTIAPGTGRLLWLIPPRLLTAAGSPPRQGGR